MKQQPAAGKSALSAMNQKRHESLNMDHTWHLTDWVNKLEGFGFEHFQVEISSKQNEESMSEIWRL